MPRLLDRYNEYVVPELMKKFGHRNRLGVPRIQKIVVSAGLGRAIENNKVLEDAVRDLAIVTGQKPLVTKAKTSVAGFKLRKGMEVGCKVTLRGGRMYEFLDRLVSIAMPRIRDFRGLSPSGFDGHGNYNLGLGEQSVFPEIDLDSVEFIQGMNISIVVSGRSDEQSSELLQLMGMPFRRS